ncbi:glycosyltransferase family 2 protein [Anaeromyxobacter paludicola]|nr:glycosyltransferase family 2 protein [Anaeromyxobacter paludicola]
MNAAPDLSVVIPLYNEEENVAPLLAELFTALERLGRRFEVVCVDDGSKDGTFAALRAEVAARPCLRVLRFRRNFGQTAAMSAGIEAARGAVIVPMDGDLQNDPADIGALLARLDGEGGERVDVVSGWRKHRKDKEFGRKLPSRIANRLISAVSGVELHDYGCSLKAYRREVIAGVRLYGEMHRFIPVYASWQGARVAEQVVNHRARRAGKSKYGLGRTGKVILDLLVVKFLASFQSNPIYLFGGAGLVSLALSFLSFAWAAGLKLLGEKDLVETPLPLLGVAFGLAGLICVLMGLLAELNVRTYYESQAKRPYLVAEELSGDDARARERAG